MSCQCICVCSRYDAGILDSSRGQAFWQLELLATQWGAWKVSQAKRSEQQRCLSCLVGPLLYLCLQESSLVPPRPRHPPSSLISLIITGRACRDEQRYVSKTGSEASELCWLKRHHRQQKVTHNSKKRMRKKYKTK